eukprot:1945819-Amphidinium_carterae.1
MMWQNEFLEWAESTSGGSYTSSEAKACAFDLADTSAPPYKKLNHNQSLPMDTFVLPPPTELSPDWN